MRAWPRSCVLPGGSRCRTLYPPRFLSQLGSPGILVISADRLAQGCTIYQNSSDLDDFGRTSLRKAI